MNSLKSFFCLFLIGLLCFSLPTFAQKKFTISGKIKDKGTGEMLIGATVTVKELKGVGTVANSYGFYSITLVEGSYNLLGRFLGYKEQSVAVTLNKDLILDIILEDDTEKMLQEVVVTDTKEGDNVTKPEMGMEKINIKSISNIPVLLGERDILKTIQLMPGIKSAGEGSSGFSVRGGNYDQNLILLDEAPVYNASHLLGFFSTFNSDAIKDATIYKGTAPAQYGGRLSSTVDLTMKDGNNQKLGVSGGIGLIASRLTLEAPIVKDKGSFIISGRRTYADAFLKLSSDPDISNNSLYFYDLNMKANYKLSAKDHIYLSGYFGRDKLGFGSSFGIDWGNATGTLRWNHLYNSKLFSNTSLIYSNYDYNIKVGAGGSDFKIFSQIKDLNFKQEFEYFANPNNSWRFGANVIHHTITPGEISSNNASTNVGGSSLQQRYSLESAIYANNSWKANDKLNINYGLRISNFTVFGKGDFYELDERKNIKSTTRYESGEVVKNYLNFEPRISMSYTMTPSSSLKLAFTRNTQNLHLMSNSTSTSPTDKWIPNSNIIKPEIANQASLGYFKNFKDNEFEFSIETYYKALENQIDYKDGADVLRNDAIETQLLFGKGRAYGVEFFLRKNKGKLTGWIGYTLSRTERQIDGINNGNWYAARQDRTHDISIVMMYQASEKWTLSANWVYQTGNAITFPSGKYQTDGQVVNYYTERNGYRMPAYHRLDFGATRKLSNTKRFSSELIFGLYNAYGRQNPFTINFRQSETNPNITEAVQTSLFRWVPSVTYNFKF